LNNNFKIFIEFKNLIKWLHFNFIIKIET